MVQTRAGFKHIHLLWHTKIDLCVWPAGLKSSADAESEGEGAFSPQGQDQTGREHWAIVELGIGNDWQMY